MTPEEKNLREYLTEQSIAAYQEHVIEECARVALKYAGQSPIVAVEIAAAIRALKEKP